VADGILTAFGGASSHAALVSRQMGKVCIVGCGALNIDYAKGTMTVGNKTLKDGDWISIDGFTGEVLAGQVATKPSEVVQVLIEKTLPPEQSRVYQQYAELMKWADEYRKLGIRTNADLPGQAMQAVAFGAGGIGLCRTEHMFFDHIEPMREMILAQTPEARKQALDKLLPYQRQDFEGLFKAMNGLPVTIRTLDPPLHEFLPHDAKGQAEVAQKLGVSAEVIADRVKSLHEFNPMLGFRGCRLGIVYPEITEMQCRAIFEAACNVHKAGTKVEPEIMIPLVGFLPELKAQAKIVHETAKKVFSEKGVSVPYLVGTMIELPRACVVADQIAKEAQFFSFGTNDLTQTTLGMSRDDYGSFIRDYMEHDIVARDPFQSIDTEGVGGLMRMGVEKGRGTRADLKVGICGEHGGDPDTVKFCHKIGLNYVSCSPFRVPIARLAAAQAALQK
jgi:pyruvate,orthophosphate dikinase